MPGEQLCSALKKVLSLHPALRVAGKSGEKELIYEKLPLDIADRHVLLMDPVLGTGNTACKSVQVGTLAACLLCMTQV